MLNYQRVQATCHAKFQAYKKKHLPSLCQSFFLENGYHSGHEWDLCNLVIPEKPKDPNISPQSEYTPSRKLKVQGKDINNKPGKVPSLTTRLH